MSRFRFLETQEVIAHSFVPRKGYSTKSKECKSVVQTSVTQDEVSHKFNVNVTQSPWQEVKLSRKWDKLGNLRVEMSLFTLDRYSTRH